MHTRILLAAIASLALSDVGTVQAAPAPIIISSCPYVISKTGFYEMQGSIGSSGSCITIKARKVTLGINGYLVNNGAPGTGTGIRIAKGATGAVIRGESTAHAVENFAIELEDDAGDAIIGDLEFLDTAKTALVLNGASSTATMLDDILVETGTGDGIDVTAPAGVRMVDTSVYQVANGIVLDASSAGSVLAGVTSAENTGTNIDIAGSGNVISFCDEGTSAYGIVIEKGSGNNIVTGCEQDEFQAPSVEDAVDKNANCGSNAWFDDVFASTSQSCIDNPPGGIAVSSCQTISATGRYYLTQSLTTRHGDCLDINGANVGLFLAGFSITGGKGGIGIHVHSTATGFRGFGGRSRSEIYGFAVGREIDADGAIFDDTGVQNATDTGTLVKNAKNVTLGATDSGNIGRFGYHFLNASGILLHNYSAFSDGIYGVFIEHSTGNLLDQFQAGNFGADGIAGIYLGCSITGPGAPCTKHPSDGNVITHGGIQNNTKYGIVADNGADKNVLVNLNTAGNGTDDLYDGNTNCANNLWFFDTFTTSNDAACMNQQ